VKKNKFLFTTFLFLNLLQASAQEVDADLSLEDPTDMNVLMEEIEGKKEKKTDEEIVDKNQSTSDDLQSIKDDLGDVEFMLPNEIDEEKKLVDEQKETATGIEKKEKTESVIVNDNMKNNTGSSGVFDVGREEKELLLMAEKMQGQIPVNEWNDLAKSSNTSTYTVRPNDWLWKISKKFFGSGFYYAKIWSLNPYITNPHLIEPGMILSFTTGTADELPTVKVGEFSDSEVSEGVGSGLKDEYDQWGDNVKPDWLNEKNKLKEDGVFVQYSNDKNDEDLKNASSRGLNKEYETYDPPRLNFTVDIPQNQYDSTGFDKNTRLEFKFKEGFYLNTFISTNIVQDFGVVDSAINEGIFISKFDRVYVRFDDRVDVVPGDKFSIYSTGGKVSQKNSDRTGYKYTIEGHVQTISKHGDLWECDVVESTGTIERGNRITVYTPKIERITQTFNSRIVEATVLAPYSGVQTAFSMGDVLYIDRGRADGLEMGNVLEVYDFKDRGTNKKITENPTYKNGELTIITLTDNFATVLVSQSVRNFAAGDVAITKTKDAAARATKIKERRSKGENERLKNDALDELDVELSLDGLNDSLLDKADKIQFSEDELAELERQEREKSVITEGERDLRSLERLEKEIETAEKLLSEAKLDEDKLLEAENLNDVEKKLLYQEQESLEEIEENFGKQFMDEDLNSKENPYGLTEYDIEEIDELLNEDKDVVQKEKQKAAQQLEEQARQSQTNQDVLTPAPVEDDVRIENNSEIMEPAQTELGAELGAEIGTEQGADQGTAIGVESNTEAMETQGASENSDFGTSGESMGTEL
jgi:hypothetical protein